MEFLFLRLLTRLTRGDRVMITLAEPRKGSFKRKKPMFLQSEKYRLRSAGIE